MFFKHLHMYRLHQCPALALEALEDELARHITRPLSGTEAKRMGWCAPAGRDGKQLIHEIQGQRLLSAMKQERLLPPSVVKEEVESRAAEIEDAEDRPLRRQEKQRIKEQVYEELLPKAFIRSQRIDLWWDTTHKLICINASSRKRAEDVLDLLRQTLGSLKVTPLATQTTPVRLMTEWLKNPATRPPWLVLQNQATLKASDDTSFTARQADLDGDEVQTMLANGCQVTRLALSVEGVAFLTMDEELSLKALRFDDALLDEASQTEDGDDPIARLEADFVLMARALNEVIDKMVEALGGEASPAAPSPELTTTIDVQVA